MLESTMQDFPLTIGMILRHGERVHSDSEVVTFEGDGCRRATFAEVATRTERLAAALRRLGIDDGDRVGTFQWNTQEHLEAYLAVPTMGAVLHTLNIRLFPDQLTYVVNHAEDRVVIVDDSLVPLLAKVAPDLSEGDSTGPTSTSAPPRACVTRAARPATRRGSCTRTGRRCCTRWASTRRRPSG
jgi:fatty-acyl-CoA synthase